MSSPTSKPFGTGMRVHLKYDPEIQGTIGMASEVGFQVSYDSHGRRRGEPRMRHFFKWSEAGNFNVGNPRPTRDDDE